MSCSRYLCVTIIWLCARSLLVETSALDLNITFVLKAAEQVIQQCWLSTNSSGVDLASQEIESLVESMASRTNDAIKTSNEACRQESKTCTRHTQCGSIPEIFQSFTNNSRLTTEGLIQALMRALDFLASNNCSHQDTDTQDDSHTLDTRRPTLGQAWGYSFGFTTVVVMMSNIGACLGPTMDKRFFRRILQFLVAMGAGSLISTSILVLVPEAFDIIAIEELSEYVWKATVTIMSIYVFFCMERLMKTYMFRKKQLKRNISIVVEEPDNNGIDDTSLTPISKVNEESHGHSHYSPESTDRQTLAWMVIVGDAFHNFVDGLSIGAAFSEDVALGVSISLAVVCETLPHELSDIAILLHSGLSMKRALFFNFMSACFCYIGLALGVTLSSLSTEASQWIFAMAGGLFLYVPLVDMLPDMSAHVDCLLMTGSTEARIVVFLHACGLVIGAGIVLFIVNVSSYIVIN